MTSLGQSMANKVCSATFSMTLKTEILSTETLDLSNQGGESRGLNDRVHGISCRYSDKTCKKINYISTNTYLIIMQ